MHISSIGCQSFTGLIHFNNIAINPNQIVSIQSVGSGENSTNAHYKSTYEFTTSDGRAYRFDGAPGFDSHVNKAMSNTKEDMWPAPYLTSDVVEISGGKEE